MLEQLLDVLALETLAEDRFRGRNMHPRGFRIYGGQVLAQAVRAAQKTVAEDRVVHSQHAYFLRPGDCAEPVVYEVERARDGGSFTSRRVVALQKGRPILVSSMSFQRPEEGYQYQSVLPEVTAPEALPTERQRAMEDGTFNEDFMITTGEDLDVRMVHPIDWRHPQQTDGKLCNWMKTTAPVADEPALHLALLTYMSDTMVLDAGLIQHGRSWMEGGLQVASLDHAIWFHAPCRADQWLLHTADLERNSGGRTLVRGRFYTREGMHVATVMQQGLMRTR